MILNDKQPISKLWGGGDGSMLQGRLQGCFKKATDREGI